MLNLPFHVMAKPGGPMCNLACRCCYYLVKERLYPGADFRMSEEVLEEYTRQYLAAHPGGEITFTWQGGEPTLMGLDFYRRAVELQQKYVRPGVRVTNTLQTNGVTLDDEWCELFREHDFLIGISVDGPDDCHDAVRVTRDGRPTLRRVVRGVRCLRDHGVRFNVLACVHQANQHRPLDVYRFFRDELGAEFIQFIPVVTLDNELRGRGGGRLIAESVGSREYGDFLIGIFDEWARRDIGRVFVQTFDAVLAGWVGENPGVCVHQETCGRAPVLEFNGDLFCCDHFVEPAYRLGNILETPLEQMLRSPELRAFGRDKRRRLPARCRECRYLSVCRGGCPKDRIIDLGDGEGPLSYLCEGLLRFFVHVEDAMEFMAAELRAGRPPANLMSRRTGVQPAHVGRNDPCPCGSGKKFKHCHGRL